MIFLMQEGRSLSEISSIGRLLIPSVSEQVTFFLVSHLLYRYKSRKNFSARLVDKKIRRYYNIEVVNLIYFYIGMWLSLVERLVRDEEAAGSNPVIPILQSRSFERFLFFVLHYVAVENDDEIKGAIAISDAPFVYEKS